MTEQQSFGTEQWKDKADALKFISQTHRSLGNQRRSSESQAFYTTVSMFAIIGAAPVTGKLHLPVTHVLQFKIGLWVLMALIAAMSCTYILGVQASNRVNRKLAEQAEMELIEMLELPGPKGHGRKIAKVYYWEAVVIVLLAVAASLSVTLFCR